jgi:hypothetical protein
MPPVKIELPPPIPAEGPLPPSAWKWGKGNELFERVAEPFDYQSLPYAPRSPQPPPDRNFWFRPPPPEGPINPDGQGYPPWWLTEVAPNQMPPSDYGTLPDWFQQMIETQYGYPGYDINRIA